MREDLSKGESLMLDFIDRPINPDTPRLFNLVSLFSGAGGSSLGYIWSGGKVLAAVEWDDNAVATYRLNFPHTPILHRDITTVTVEEMLKITGLHPGELDILDGSPPCQGFSTAGKRQIDDPRNSLFREYVRLLRGLQPKVFVMENVSGMVKGHMKHVFAIAMRELKASGYTVKCQLMNAMYFGVPQSRERVIFIGVRNDLGIEPSHPKAETREIGISSIFHDVIATRSMKINPWIHHPRAAATVTKTDSDYQFLCRDKSIRKPIIQEVARLASFPDAFQWRKDGWARIGNSVPPMFMRAIASHVYEHILSRVKEVAHA